MHCSLPVLALVLLTALAARAQTVTVETVVPAGSAIDDALALGPDGALYGSRFGTFDPFVPGETVTRVDLATGATSVYASGLSFANGLAFTPDGDLVVANYFVAATNSGRVSAVAPDGTVRTLATLPNGVTVSGAVTDPATGGLVLASYDAGWIRTLSPDGVFADVVTSGLNGPAGLAYDDAGRLHVANFNDGKVFRVEGGALVPLADLGTAVGFLAYGGGRFVATGIADHRVYAIDPDGTVSVLAGTGVAGTADGPGDAARFDRPNGVVATADGRTIYVSDAGSRAVRRITVADATADEAAPVRTGALGPVVPNPTVGAAAVTVTLDAPGEVTLTVHDALGRRVRTVAGPRAAGAHRVALDTRGLAPGVYTVTLRHGGRVESRRLVRR